jgi:predicted kinase
MPCQIVLVSGAPGAGKTTLAVPLACELGFPLLSKDDIKDALWDALDLPSADLLWSRKVGGAAMEVLWTLAMRYPCAVLEAPFRPPQRTRKGTP